MKFIFVPVLRVAGETSAISEGHKLCRPSVDITFKTLSACEIKTTRKMPNTE